jgi:hypothetical protein
MFDMFDLRGFEMRAVDGIRRGSSVVVESAFRQAEWLVIGDPKVAASGPAVELDETTGELARFVDRPGGRLLVLRNPWPEEAALVSAAGYGDERVDRLALSFGDGDARPGSPEVAGTLECPSGRLVVGTPEAVAAWGAEARPADGLSAQARAYRYGRVPALLGLVVVAQVKAGWAPVELRADAEGRLVDVTVSTPGRPVQERLDLLARAG